MEINGVSFVALKVLKLNSNISLKRQYSGFATDSVELLSTKERDFLKMQFLCFEENEQKSIHHH